MDGSHEDSVVVLLCTVPSAEVGAALAESAVRARLAACVNVIEGVRSFYMWEGALCDERELQLLLKTTRGRAGALRDLLTQQHPYDVPEILVLPVDGPLSGAAYLRFVQQAVS